MLEILFSLLFSGYCLALWQFYGFRGCGNQQTVILGHEMLYIFMEW